MNLVEKSSRIPAEIQLSPTRYIKSHLLFLVGLLFYFPLPARKLAVRGGEKRKEESGEEGILSKVCRKLC